MAKRLRVELSAEQWTELQDAQRHHPKAYVRERAAAILKVAQGQAVCQVARSGLLQVREPETVSDWIGRYLGHGLPGLLVDPGRGRKPAFSPSASRRRSGTGRID